VWLIYGTKSTGLFHGNSGGHLTPSPSLILVVIEVTLLPITATPTRLHSLHYTMNTQHMYVTFVTKSHSIFYHWSVN